MKLSENLPGQGPEQTKETGENRGHKAGRASEWHLLSIIQANLRKTMTILVDPGADAYNEGSTHSRSPGGHLAGV